MSPNAPRFVWFAATRGGRCACGPAGPVPWPLLALKSIGIFVSALLMLAWFPTGALAESVALAGMMG